jgi:hypothetical protein
MFHSAPLIFNACFLDLNLRHICNNEHVMSYWFWSLAFIMQKAVQWHVHCRVSIANKLFCTFQWHSIPFSLFNPIWILTVCDVLQCMVHGLTYYTYVGDKAFWKLYWMFSQQWLPKWRYSGMMGRTSKFNWRRSIAYKIFVKNHVGERILKKPSRRQENTRRTDLSHVRCI